MVVVASSKRNHTCRTASQLVASGEVSAEQVYAATLVLAKLQDRGVALAFTVEEMCEVLGYAGKSRPPSVRRPQSA